MRSNRTLTHEQARQYLQATVDRQLNPNHQPALERHLAGCPGCQRYAEQLALLEMRLEVELQAAWPIQPVAESQAASTVEKIHHQTRRISMKNIISSTARTLAYGLGIVGLIAGLAWGIRTLRPGGEATQPVDTQVVAPQEMEQPLEVTTLPPPTEDIPTPVAPGTAGLFPTTGFRFPNGFPESVETINLYRILLPDAVTPETALQMAGRLGVSGWVYSQPSEGFDQTIYEVTNGFELLRFINFAEQFVFETSHVNPMYSNGPPLPYEEQLRIATDYLNDYGLLDQSYRATPAPIERGVVIFTPLLEGRPLVYGNGQNPGNMEWISVQVDSDGLVNRVMYSQQHYELIGEYPILSAQQTWERLTAANADQRVQYAVMPAEQTNTYRVWTRSYLLGQTVDLYGYVYVRRPINPTDPVLVSFNNFQVANGEALASLDPGTNIHALGQFIQDEQGHLLFEIAEWEISTIVDEYYEGTIQRMGEGGYLVSENGSLLLPELPVGVPEGWQVFASGILLPGEPATLNWHSITGGSYPNSYYSSRSCGGGGGGGGGGPENVNFGGGGFGLPNLDPDQDPTATPSPGPYAIGDRIEGRTGRVYAINNIYSDGSSVYEFNIMMDPLDEAPFGDYFRLQGEATVGLNQYQNLPVRIWGQVIGYVEGTPIVALDRFEAQYPGLSIQQWNGTESIVNLDGQDVVLLTTDSGDAYVLQSSITWGAEANVIGYLGDWIEIEGYIIPDRRFGGYPVIQDLSGGMPPDQEVTSDDIFIYDHSFDPPNISTLMSGQVTIDSIELAYASITMQNCLSSHSTDPNMIPFLTVQPVWVYTGHFDDGRIIVIQVQALPEEYLQ
jgi:hypothetical protein